MYTLYKTTNTINGRYYIGVHKTEDPNDSYLGSGLAIKRAIAQYGRAAFVKEVLAVFDTAEEAFLAEQRAVVTASEDPLSYNLMRGGIGGFDHINVARHLYPNPMKTADVVRRNIESRRRNLERRPDLRAQLLEASLRNLEKAKLTNTGKKRPQHAALMREKQSARWSDPLYREQFRNSASGTYEVISPDGSRTITNRLGEFCDQHKVSFPALWRTSKLGRPILKGPNKGWQCNLIT